MAILFRDGKTNFGIPIPTVRQSRCGRENPWLTGGGGNAQRDDPARRDRLFRLSEASLCINESLDFDTVLQEVADNDRALTDSQYGVISTLDGSGRPPDFVTSGLTLHVR